MANLISLSRLLLLAAVVVLAYAGNWYFYFINVVLLIVMFVSDAVDGYVARKRNEASQFGAMLDIASDRIVELVLWIALVDLNYVAGWVLMVFIVRGALVDTIRGSRALKTQTAPFETLRSRLGRWLVASQTMRVGYAVLKAVAFCWLMLYIGLDKLGAAWWQPWRELAVGVADTLVVASVLICVLRGLPVIIEFLYHERHQLLGNLFSSGERQSAR